MRGLEDIFKIADIARTYPIFALKGAQSFLGVHGFSSQGAGPFRSNGKLPQKQGAAAMEAKYSRAENSFLTGENQSELKR
jgi:hypothetical protein